MFGGEFYLLNFLNLGTGVASVKVRGQSFTLFCVFLVMNGDEHELLKQIKWEYTCK